MVTDTLTMGDLDDYARYMAAERMTTLKGLNVQVGTGLMRGMCPDWMPTRLPRAV